MARAVRITFSLEPGLAAALEEAVRRGDVESKDVFVQRALWRELRELRREREAAEWQIAARDPLFLKDIQDVERAFQSADAEAIQGQV
jgi:hypothetical protein